MSAAAKPGASSPRLEIYIVQVQRGGEIEHYWVDGRSPKAAIRAAARYAGVAIGEVLHATLQTNGEPG